MLLKSNIFGLVGRGISYSFSRVYFTEKFSKPEFKNFSYENFDFENLDYFKEFINQNPELKGLNVTIPYKEKIINQLDDLSEIAAEIGAVNVIKFNKNGELIGYNSDWFGFTKAIEPSLKSHHKKALILGTGGSSKAVAYALKKMGISYCFVSRSNFPDSKSYFELNKNDFEEFQIIINCTPLGTSPNIESYPSIPYQFLTSSHLVFDLIYNPSETLFLQKAKEQGAVIKNGADMLIFQAEKAWEIWNL